MSGVDLLAFSQVKDEFAQYRIVSSYTDLELTLLCAEDFS